MQHMHSYQNRNIGNYTVCDSVQLFKSYFQGRACNSFWHFTQWRAGEKTPLCSILIYLHLSTTECSCIIAFYQLVLTDSQKGTENACITFENGGPSMTVISYLTPGTKFLLSSIGFQEDYYISIQSFLLLNLCFPFRNIFKMVLKRINLYIYFPCSLLLYFHL